MSNNKHQEIRQDGCLQVRQSNSLLQAKKRPEEKEIKRREGKGVEEKTDDGIDSRIRIRPTVDLAARQFRVPSLPPLQPRPAMEAVGMSTMPAGLDYNNSVRSSTYDPAVEPTIRALLEQQVEIQAKLAALLPRKYGPNIRLELQMLRHKRRALLSYAEEHRM